MISNLKKKNHDEYIITYILNYFIELFYYSVAVMGLLVLRRQSKQSTTVQYSTYHLQPRITSTYYVQNKNQVTEISKRW